MSSKETELISITEAEANSLATKIADGVEMTYIGYRKANGLAIDGPDWYVTDLLDRPASEVTFHDLQLIAADDPTRASAMWLQMRKQAEDELASGFSVVNVLKDILQKPFEQARFLVLRESLASEWKPANGIERNLIDEIAKARTLSEYWTKQLLHRQTYEDDHTLRERQKEGKKRDIYWDEWVPARVSAAEGIEQARQNAEMWERIAIRELRQLRDLRRYTPVIVQNAGQVNVGGQQVNVAGAENPPPRKCKSRVVQT